MAHDVSWPAGRRWLTVLLLVAGFACPAAPRITEFLAANDAGLADDDGAFSDWIEIHNPDDLPVSLAGYSLTDNPADLRRWRFPAVALDPGAYLVVFASGKDRPDPGAPLHTNFQLSSAGEYLALVAPDGVTVVSAFAPAFPPQFEDTSFGPGPNGPPPAWSYFRTPTPGAPNAPGERAGPVVQPLVPNPPPPVSGPLAITARVLPVNDPVASLRLYSRRMFNAETAVEMTDDGTGADAVAGDGVWSAAIPAAAFAPGEMTRWRFVATDVRGVTTREPAFREPLDADQYYGTVTRNPALESALPVLHWFTTNVTRAGTTAGARGSVYYDGEFYDNVLFTLHGQSSAGFPKKSYNLDFNRTHRFRWSPEAPRVADIDLLSNWADKSKVRHVLAYEVMRKSGVAAHFAFTVRVQHNGSFFSTADLVEDADEIYLERAGLNPEGALYKIYANLLNKDAGNTATTGVEKKTRRFENNNDLQDLINGLDLTGPALERYLYDHIDIPACVNFLAANSVIRNIDMHSKNWYAYRDTGRSGEWSILPWDLDLSHGRVWTTRDTYFDNALYTDGFVVTGTSVRLVAHLFNNPSIRAMILRRIRTLTDRFLQPPPAPGTPDSERFYERRLDEQAALIDPPDIVPSDARRDFEKWGSWLQGGSTVPYTSPASAVETMAEAILRWKNEYLPGRRSYIYNTQIVGRGGEIPLPANQSAARTNFTPLVVEGAPVRVLVPADGRLGLTWTGDPAREPFPTPGWIAGNTGVGYERATGYESLIRTDLNTRMQTNTSVYLRLEFDVPDPAAFDRLQLRMKYDDGFAAFLNGIPLASANAPASLQWNSAAPSSREANPSAYTLFDVSDRLSALRPGRNVLAIQGLNDSLASSDLIVLPELHGGRFVPASQAEPRIDFGTIEASPASGNQDEEFIELRNRNAVAVDLSDWRLTGGVEHRFPGGTVLPANGALYLCPRAEAFRARAASPKGGEGRLVQGGYRGRLSSLGETLILLEATGVTNHFTTYAANPSDPQRHLVISEILFHPADDDLAEFIELLNISSQTTLSLAGVRFTAGVEFDFTGSAITHLPPGGRVLVVRDLAAFTATYGTNRPVAGVFARGTALSNAGERLELVDANDDPIRELTYDDQAPWPTLADAGHSLVLLDPQSNPDPAIPAHWRASARPGGNPGGPDDAWFPSDPLADADGNGERDLIDYALGNDPDLPPMAPRLARVPDFPGGPTVLRLTHTRRLDTAHVDLTVHFSTDLSTWQDATPHLELVSRQDLGDGRELLAWHVKPSLNGLSGFYLRLLATMR